VDHREGVLCLAPLTPLPGIVELRIMRPSGSSPWSFRWQTKLPFLPDPGEKAWRHHLVAAIGTRHGADAAFSRIGRSAGIGNFHLWPVRKRAQVHHPDGWLARERGDRRRVLRAAGRRAGRLAGSAPAAPAGRNGGQSAAVLGRVFAGDTPMRQCARSSLGSAGAIDDRLPWARDAETSKMIDGDRCSFGGRASKDSFDPDGKSNLAPAEEYRVDEVKCRTRFLRAWRLACCVPQDRSGDELACAVAEANPVTETAR